MALLKSMQNGKDFALNWSYNMWLLLIMELDLHKKEFDLLLVSWLVSFSSICQKFLIKCNVTVGGLKILLLENLYHTGQVRRATGNLRQIVLEIGPMKAKKVWKKFSFLIWNVPSWNAENCWNFWPASNTHQDISFWKR